MKDLGNFGSVEVVWRKFDQAAAPLGRAVIYKFSMESAGAASASIVLCDLSFVSQDPHFPAFMSS